MSNWPRRTETPSDIVVPSRLMATAWSGPDPAVGVPMPRKVIAPPPSLADAEMFSEGVVAATS